MLGVVGKRELFWGYAAQGLNIGAGLLLLPFVVHYLTAPELGLWYVFLALASLAQLLEFGFQPTIVRHASYVYSGAQELRAHGLPSGERRAMDPALLADLIAACRHIYRCIAIGAAVVLWGGGTAYLLTLEGMPGTPTTVVLTWMAFSAGAVVTFYYGYINGILQGRGEITAANQLIVITRGAQVALAIPLLTAGAGLAGLAAAWLAAAVICRWAALRRFAPVQPSNLGLATPREGDSARLSRTLWQSAWRLGLTQLGAFLVLRANIFVASSLIGLAAAAAYGLSLQLFTVLSSLAAVLATLLLPRMNALQVAGDRERLRLAFCTAVVFAWSSFIVGGLFIVSTGAVVLEVLGSRTTLLPWQWMAMLLVVFLLELNHSISAMYITTHNRVPFVRAALGSGVAIVSLSMVLVTTTDLSLGALIIAQGVVQLAYNNWKWPHEAMRELQCSVGDVLRLGWGGVRGMMRVR